MTRTLSIAIISALIVAAPAIARERAPARQDTPELWRAVSQKLPIGSIVKVRTKDGDRLTAILFACDDAAITVKPKTRYPEPAKRIPFERIENVELQRPGVSYAKAVGIGAAVGASVLLVLIAAAQ